jgi:hypothetical protein
MDVRMVVALFVVMVAGLARTMRISSMKMNRELMAVTASVACG